MWKRWLLVTSVSFLAGVGGTVAYTHWTVQVTTPVVQVAPPSCPSPEDREAARKMIEEAGRHPDTSTFVPRGRVLSLE